MAEPPWKRLGANGYIATMGGDDQDGKNLDRIRRRNGWSGVCRANMQLFRMISVTAIR
jgi:hypothetical protein